RGPYPILRRRGSGDRAPTVSNGFPKPASRKPGQPEEADPREMAPVSGGGASAVRLLFRLHAATGLAALTVRAESIAADRLALAVDAGLARAAGDVEAALLEFAAPPHRIADRARGAVG